MANNLFKVGLYSRNKNNNYHARIMLNNVKENSIRYGLGGSNWLNLYANLIGEFYEIAIVGEDAHKKLFEINQRFIPNKLIIGSTTESNLPLLEYKYTKNVTTIYVCIDGACHLPVTNTNDALKQINIKF
jgi:uncharacterized protein YyaL (SSP411 family)